MPNPDQAARRYIAGSRQPTDSIKYGIAGAHRKATNETADEHRKQLRAIAASLNRLSARLDHIADAMNQQETEKEEQQR